MGRLRTIATVLRAATGLDGKQNTTLHVGGVVPLAMYLMGLINQLEQWKAIKLERALKKSVHEHLYRAA